MTGWLKQRTTGRRMVAVTAAFLAAAALAAAPVAFSSPHRGLGIEAAGSRGSLPHYPWWDPRGWFGSGAPSSHVLAGTGRALPSRGQALREVAAAPPVRRVGELAAKRSAYGRVYRLSDGRLQAVISAAPVNYRDKAGRWAPVSTAVTRSGRAGFAFENVTNSFRSFFGTRPGQRVRFEAPGGGWLSMGMVGGRAVAPRAAGNVVGYPGVAAGTGLSYQVTPAGLKERITLASAAAPASFTFTIRAGGGLAPVRRPGGAIAWSRAGGPPVLVIPAPVMTDAKPSGFSPYGTGWSPKVAQRAVWDAAARTLRVTLTPDRGWLDAPGRVFPVVVDPTIEIAPTPTDAQNTFIEQDTPSSNYNSSWRLPVGTTSGGGVRSLLSFPLSAIPPNTPIDSADLNLYFDQNFGPGTSNQTVNAYQATASWTADSATWSNASNNVGTEGLNEVYVDDSNTTGASAAGSWPSQADSNAINGEYRYDQDTVSGDTFTWVPKLTESGTYSVADHYVADSAAASSAPFTVYYNGGSKAFTVNQQSGTGGVWSVLGSEPFAAGTAGKVVLGDGPASSTVRVEADQTRFRKWGSVVVNPNNANIWDSFSVRNIVQSWLNGSAPNDGFVLKAADESTLNVGGPRYEASRFAYQGETINYPQLVVTYGRPAVTLNPITTINATGANLSWTSYTDPTPSSNTGDDLAEYQVHRSVYQSFTPDASTLVSPVAAGTTSFDDTSEPPTPATASEGNAFYYMVAVKTADGQVIPGATRLVRLPVAGHTIQIIHASGAATLSKALPTTNEQNLAGQPWLATGDNSTTYGVTRAVVSYPSLSSSGIPAGATVTEAHLKLWGWFNNNTGGGSAAYEAHALTQSFTASQVTWNNASSTTAWTTAGGAYNPAVADTVTGLTSDPNRENWEVTSITQGWLTTPSSEHGLLVKLSGESSTSPQEQELFLNNAAAEQALAPELVVTYLTTTPDYTYFAPHTPHVAASASSYSTDVTVTNTTAATMNASDWVLTYHWLTPDGTDVTTSTDQAKTALPSSLAPGATATITAAVDTPDTTGSGSDVTGYRLLWDLFDKTTGTWLSSGTSTPNLAGTSTTAGTVGPLNQVTSVARSAGDLLGLEKYYQYTGVNTGSGTSLLNNDGTGNVVWNYNAFSNPSRGFQTFVRMSYNSMDTSDSSMGFGWSLEASSLMRLGSPLDFHPYPNPATVTLTDGDGTTHAFTWNSTTSTWVSPPGLHYFLQQQAACDASEKTDQPRAWLLTAPDRTEFFFDCQGYQTAVVDKNSNTANFTYTWRNSSNKPVKFLDYITDPSGRQTLTIAYYHKGDSYSYIDSNGNVASGTNLTDPDIIDKIKSLTDISGRTITFLYDTEGLMAQMTDGDGTSVAKTFKFGYDMTQGNKNVKLVSVTDPRGNTTGLAYYTAPQDPTFKWSLETITDRLQHATSFAYTVPATGEIQTQVTDPLTHTTTYLIDSTGRPVQITNPRGFNTFLSWDAGNNVTSLKEDNGATTTWTWDPNTGYPLTKTDAQANHDGTAGYTYSYQTGLSGHTADLTSLLTPQQRLWTFGYDSFGNLTSVTKPLGNVSGATAGSYTTTYTYNSDGTLHTATDPDGNPTTYSAYDPTGYPGAVKDGRGNTTSYLYSPTGNVTSVTDAYNNTTTQQYDIFGRPGQHTVPKSSSQTVTIAAPVYDGNDNVTTSYAPSYSSTTPGPATSYVFDAGDQITKKVTPADTSTSPSPTTTYQYYADSTLQSVTRPNGNVSGATASQFTTTYTYWPDQTLKSVTDGLGGVTSYTYDDVGNKQTLTDPNGNLTQYAYDLNHQITQVTDAASNTTQTGYDLDGLVTSVTDANNNTTLYSLDADGQVTQQKVPAQAPGAAVSYDVTQYAYDQAGNRTQVLTPRAIAAGYSLSSSCVTTPTTSPCPDTWVTGYNGDNTMDLQQSPANPGDPVYPGPQSTNYTHDKDNRLSKVTLPSSNGSPSAANATTYSYFDNGWLSSSADPRGVTTAWDYNAYGEQATRTLENTAVTAMNRSQTWSYYPDGKLQSLTDNGVPTGMYAEVVDNTDASNATSSPSTSWPSTSCPAGCDGYSYQANSSGSGTFTWHLNIPSDGNYTIYVKYPQVSGAATGAAYTVSHSGGSASVTLNQTQNSGTWVKLGEWAFTRAGTGQQVTLTANATGTAVANAAEAVRDTTGTSNTASNGYTYSYDADGNRTGVTTTSTTTASTGSTTSTTGSDLMQYDQLDRVASVQENDGSGTQQHLTSYTYDPAANLKTLTHANGPSGSAVTDQYSAYTYTNLNQLQNETDGTSASDPSPKVTLFTYTPTGQLHTEVKPNNGNTIASPTGNLVTDTYYASDQLRTQTEYTSDSTTTGTLVSSHTYTYDPNGNQTQDIQKLMSADNNATYLSHTLDYTYSPLDQLATVTTDATQTEQYNHDPEGNVTSQTINGTTTSYNYDRGLLETSASGGSTAYYNYDPLGRLDTITSGSPGGTTLETSTYDGFDNLLTHTQATGTGTTTTNYTYDPLNRLASQTTGTATTSYAYLGLTSELAKETDPGSQTKNYSYTPDGMRLFQTTTTSTGTVTPGYYSYNNHGDVEAVTGANGNTTATYGYTADGANITSMFTGADKNNTSPGSATTPYNSYRYNGMRWDTGSGQYDMGFRNYDPGLNSFTSRDMYDDALADTSLTTDPFTGSRYAFGDGNPITNIELDGHTQCDAGYCPTQQQTRQVTQAAAQYGSGCPSTEPGCPGYQAPAKLKIAPQGGIGQRDCNFAELARVGPVGSCTLTAASLIDRLPRGGSFPFEPKKGQRLSDPRSISRQDGNPVDKYGDVWEWDPVKGEWDVQTGKEHTNIDPNGKITHGENNTGRIPRPPTDDSSSAAKSVAVGAGIAGTGTILWWLGKLASPVCGPAAPVCAVAF